MFCTAGSGMEDTRWRERERVAGQQWLRGFSKASVSCDGQLWLSELSAFLLRRCFFFSLSLLQFHRYNAVCRLHVIILYPHSHKAKCCLISDTPASACQPSLCFTLPQCRAVRHTQWLCLSCRSHGCCYLLACWFCVIGAMWPQPPWNPINVCEGLECVEGLFWGGKDRMGDCKGQKLGMLQRPL